MYSASLIVWGSFAFVFAEAAAAVAMMLAAAASVAAMWKDVKFGDVDVAQGQWAGPSLKSRLYRFVSFSLHCV